MQSRALIIIALLAGGGVLVLSLFAERQSVQEADQSIDSEVATASTEYPDPLETAEASVRSESELATPVVGLPAAFSRFSDESVDSIFRRLLQTALEGNVDAQFLLYEAANYCEDGYRAYFDRGQVRRTLDEALHWASTRPAVSMEDVKTLHARCNEWMSVRPQYGSAADWLGKALAAGSPKALAATASELLAKAEMVRADDAKDLKRAAAQRGEARELMLKALNADDSSATWQIGENLMFLGGVTGTEKDQAAVWKLAACNQGYDCSPRADWLLRICSFDQNCTPGESGVQFIRRNATEFPGDLDQAAAQLAERIRQGNITHEEFDSLVAPQS